MITREDFNKVEMRVWTIIKVDDFPEAQKPAYQVTIDFWEFWIKKSSAQITKLYTKEQLVDKQIVAVTNFPPKQVANFMSECLILWAIAWDKEYIVLSPERTVKNWSLIA